MSRRPDDKAVRKAKQQVFTFLQEKAKSQTLTTYGEVASHVSVMKLEARDALLDQILSEISQEEHSKQHGMLSAIVTQKNCLGPGNGFFKVAGVLESLLKRNGSEPKYGRLRSKRSFSTGPAGSEKIFRRPRFQTPGLENRPFRCD